MRWSASPPRDWARESCLSPHASRPSFFFRLSSRRVQCSAVRQREAQWGGDGIRERVLRWLTEAPLLQSSALLPAALSRPPAAARSSIGMSVTKETIAQHACLRLLSTKLEVSQMGSMQMDGIHERGGVRERVGHSPTRMRLALGSSSPLCDRRCRAS